MYVHTGATSQEVLAVRDSQILCFIRRDDMKKSFPTALLWVQHLARYVHREVLFNHVD